ncbi:hypothetical protein BE221DRAFT_77225 [Ostreococcus tauri]|uniref:Helicase ATP-binding domain-containing protein n=1 Tax=Ostreococcus tauri TaxID=70448 RepID=A0A1Y5I9E4_OSTTA|nr:hypothetical protein BE221DRAFT_77225 [Ostreococcus tauri]
MPALARRDFPSFPYAAPYGIQKDLMRRVYDACERKKTFGVFESPTGTGKTLSVLIGALSWIDDRRRRRLRGETSTSDSEDAVEAAAGRGAAAAAAGRGAADDEPDWLKEYDAKRRKTDADSVEKRRQEIRREMRERASKAEQRAILRRDAEKRLREQIASANANAETRSEVDKYTAEEREFLVDEYDSSAEHAVEDLRTLLRDGDDESDDEDESARREEDEALRPAQQIILCSRTHSQLTQVIGELRKTVFGGKVEGAPEMVTAAAVAGRAQLCVNPAVKSLGSAARINERCLDMSRGKKKPGEKEKHKACPFLSKRRKALLELKEAALAKPMDIEDLAKLGETRRACPYYAARSALPEADLVLMPYASLLHADTRETLGVRLENAVVVFDEAHNLVDAVHNSYGAAATLDQLNDVDDMVTAYVERFKTRLSAMGAVHALSSLIEALASADSDGRIVYERAADGEPAKLRFILLDAASRFRRVVDAARSVILVGGTLAPFSELVAQLYPELDVTGSTTVSTPARSPNAGVALKTFTCGHIIPRDNLLAVPLPAGPTGVALDFTHASRSSASLIDELGRIVLNACRVAPGGACVFFPSFAYADDVCARWDATGAMAAVRAVKDVYREPRDGAALEQCLRDYAASISRATKPNGGAVLLCVVGGKLSEGINFSDDLGRLVVVVGLPYANVADAELRARMDHLDATGERGRGRAYYEALCARAVNQSIGRAVRHVGDYAAVLLCDVRWGPFASTSGKRGKHVQALPEWIARRLATPTSYGDAHGALARFFRDKRIRIRASPSSAAETNG